MRKIAILAVAAAATLVPSVAAAQAVPGAVVAIVDLDRVSSQCTACKSAQASLQSQVNALRARQQALATPLEAEGKSIQAAVDALPQGKAPDAPLQARIRAFQTKQQQGAQELQSRQTQIQRNQAYVSQQVSSKLGPIYQSVMQRRGANILVAQDTVLASTTGVDVTNDVLAALNAALPSVSTTAPAATQQQPQGR